MCFRNLPPTLSLSRQSSTYGASEWPCESQVCSILRQNSVCFVASHIAIRKKVQLLIYASLDLRRLRDSNACNCKWMIAARQAGPTEPLKVTKYFLEHNHALRRVDNVVRLSKRHVPREMLESLGRLREIGIPASKAAQLIEIPLEGGITGTVRIISMCSRDPLLSKIVHLSFPWCRSMSILWRTHSSFHQTLWAPWKINWRQWKSEADIPALTRKTTSFCKYEA